MLHLAGIVSGIVDSCGLDVDLGLDLEGSSVTFCGEGNKGGWGLPVGVRS